MICYTRGLFPAVSDLAREVRYRYFDHPLFEGARTKVYEEVNSHLRYLNDNPTCADRHERLRALVDCPQPLLSLFAHRLAAAAPALRELKLEVLTWRYYRIRVLTNVCSHSHAGYSVASGQY